MKKLLGIAPLLGIALIACGQTTNVTKPINQTPVANGEAQILGQVNLQMWAGSEGSAPAFSQTISVKGTGLSSQTTTPYPSPTGDGYLVVTRLVTGSTDDVVNFQRYVTNVFQVLNCSAQDMPNITVYGVNGNGVGGTSIYNIAASDGLAIRAPFANGTVTPGGNIIDVARRITPVQGIRRTPTKFVTDAFTADMQIYDPINNTPTVQAFVNALPNTNTNKARIKTVMDYGYVVRNLNNGRLVKAATAPSITPPSALVPCAVNADKSNIGVVVTGARFPRARANTGIDFTTPFSYVFSTVFVRETSSKMSESVEEQGTSSVYGRKALLDLEGLGGIPVNTLPGTSYADPDKIALSCIRMAESGTFNTTTGAVDPAGTAYPNLYLDSATVGCTP
jgi:hypothetical protein